MRDCAFTICTKNYLGFVKVLENSILQFSPDIDFYIIVADEIDLTQSVSKNVLVAKNILEISNSQWQQQAFKYSLVEFCTFLKPYIFEYFGKNRGYEKICYFDPDLYFFSSPMKIFNELNDCEILVTPHIINISITENSDSTEYDSRLSGIFNFGFIAIKIGQSSLVFLDWWKNRLKDKCFFDSVNFLCTDQKWGDLLPCYFSSDVLKISRDPGWNIAPWNFCERELIIQNNKIVCRNRFDAQSNIYDVLFAHFSGYDYKKIFSGEFVESNDHSNILYKDVSLIQIPYMKAMLEQEIEFKKHINLPYTYGFFSNGKKIEKFHRRIYHGFCLLDEDVGNPFDSRNKIFTAYLEKRKMFSANSTELFHDHVSDSSASKILCMINYLMRVIYSVIGFKRYISMLKFFQAYSRYENQIHLVDKQKNVLFFRKRMI